MASDKGPTDLVQCMLRKGVKQLNLNMKISSLPQLEWLWVGTVWRVLLVRLCLAVGFCPATQPLAKLQMQDYHSEALYFIIDQNS